MQFVESDKGSKMKCRSAKDKVQNTQGRIRQTLHWKIKKENNNRVNT